MRPSTTSTGSPQRKPTYSYSGTPGGQPVEPEAVRNTTGSGPTDTATGHASPLSQYLRRIALPSLAGSQNRPVVLPSCTWRR